ncbi:A/G-specific adenine glycosylase [Pullulanibacillus pueri]|nr:A/G-specific adenine glycosylase [Pullulanibacillus pueri]
MLNAEMITGFQEHLLHWYRKNHRDLPWRRTSNPYYIWVSEVMLQQTQVDTVIPYYEEFISRFPTMHELARAPQEEVLKRWEGLGYYSRARNLQSGVQEVVEKYNAKVPENKKDLLSVKGVGPYTAGAILSIAYQKPEPAVDGNVMRVLSRIFLIDEDITKVKTRQTFETILYDLIPEMEASAFNQALMEIGALICKPKGPICEECPLAHLCRSKAEGTQLHYPVKKKKMKPKDEAFVAVVLKDTQEKLLIQKRPEKGLLANFWEFPLLEMSDTQEDPLKVVKSYFNKKNHDLIIEWTKSEQTVTHTFSHLKWHVNIVVGTLREGTLNLGKMSQWISEKALKEYPFPVPQQKVMSIVGIDY